MCVSAFWRSRGGPPGPDEGSEVRATQRAGRATQRAVRATLRAYCCACRDCLRGTSLETHTKHIRGCKWGGPVRPVVGTCKKTSMMLTCFACSASASQSFVETTDETRAECGVGRAVPRCTGGGRENTGVARPFCSPGLCFLGFRWKHRPNTSGMVSGASRSGPRW